MKGKDQIVKGIISVTIGVVIFMWAQAHSPHTGFFEMLTKFDSYYLKKPFYNLVIAVSIGLGIFGIVLLVLGISATDGKAVPSKEHKEPCEHINQTGGFCTKCGIKLKGDNDAER